VHAFPVGTLAYWIAVDGSLAGAAGAEGAIERGLGAQAVVAGCAHGGAIGKGEDGIREGCNEVTWGKRAGCGECAASSGGDGEAGAWRGHSARRSKSIYWKLRYYHEILSYMSGKVRQKKKVKRYRISGMRLEVRLSKMYPIVANGVIHEGEPVAACSGYVH
jgi:hypothetical protein